MAMNIGANDVANTMGPTVGSGTLTVIQALILAAVCNLAGAIIAGGDVVSTVSKGIIDISVIDSADVFIWAMVAALLAAASGLILRPGSARRSRPRIRLLAV